MLKLATSVVFACIAASSVHATEISSDQINGAVWHGLANEEALVIKSEVLLDRAGFSPGEVDGQVGDNYKKAIAAFALERGIENDGKLTEAVWLALATTSRDPVIVKYKLTRKDVDGPFLDEVPTKLDKMRGIKSMAFGSAREALAERFHMSESLLSKMNPGQHFEHAGEEIDVAGVTDRAPRSKAARLEVDKTAQTLRAFDRDNKLIGFFPITAGSELTPSPSGELKIRSVARNPTYRYNPDYGFKGVRAKHSFKISPGPNNPVGRVWIGLPGEGYGIHGTPEPAKIGKTESHGCIRMTNWDALELAALVSKGTPVSFIGSEKIERPRSKRLRRVGSRA